jgi:hypothetical protein
LVRRNGDTSAQAQEKPPWLVEDPNAFHAHRKHVLQKARQQRQRCAVDIIPLHTCHVVDHE